MLIYWNFMLCCSGISLFKSWSGNDKCRESHAKCQKLKRINSNDEKSLKNIYIFIYEYIYIYIYIYTRATRYISGLIMKCEYLSSKMVLLFFKVFSSMSACAQTTSRSTLSTPIATSPKHGFRTLQQHLLVRIFIPISIWKQVKKYSRSSPTINTYFLFYYF